MRRALRRACRAVLFAAALIGPAGVVLGESTTSEDGLVREILVAREELRAAVAAKDPAALAKLYDPDFRHIRDSGRIDLTAERISLVLSGESTIETAPEEGVTVQVFGGATAIATGVSRIKDAVAGRPTPFRWLVVYVKGEGGWRIVASQASRVPTRPR